MRALGKDDRRVPQNRTPNEMSKNTLTRWIMDPCVRHPSAGGAGFWITTAMGHGRSAFVR